MWQYIYYVLPYFFIGVETMNYKYTVIKRIMFGLFLFTFMINVLFTGYARSIVKTYNTGSEIIGGAGAFVSGAGPFSAFVILALLAAGLAVDDVSDLDAFVRDLIYDRPADGALSYILNSGIYDENGNINYELVAEGVNAYVEAAQISLDMEAFKIQNDVLYVAPEVINAVACDLREAFDEGVFDGYYYFHDFKNGYSITFDLESGFTFPKGSDADLKISNIIVNGYSYVILKHYGYYTVYYHTTKTLSIGMGEKYCYLVGPTKSSPYGGWYNFNEDGTASNADTSLGYSQGYINNKLLDYIIYYGNSFGLDTSFTDFLPKMSASLPASNDYPLEGWNKPVLRDLYEDILDAALDVPVVDLPVDNTKPVVIDGVMVDDLVNVLENVIGVAEGIGEDVDEKEKVIADSIAAALEGVMDNAAEREKENINTPSIPDVDLGDLKSPGLDDKFPFCIPFDLIDLISALDAEPEAPKFTIPVIKNEEYGWDYSVTVDWSDFDVVAKVCRSVEIFCFIGFLILKTRSLIRG